MNLSKMADALRRIPWNKQAKPARIAAPRPAAAARSVDADPQGTLTRCDFLHVFALSAAGAALPGIVFAHGRELALSPGAKMLGDIERRIFRRDDLSGTPLCINYRQFISGETWAIDLLHDGELSAAQLASHDKAAAADFARRLR